MKNSFFGIGQILLSGEGSFFFFFLVKAISGIRVQLMLYFQSIYFLINVYFASAEIMLLFFFVFFLISLAYFYNVHCINVYFNVTNKESNLSARV